MGPTSFAKPPDCAVYGHGFPTHWTWHLPGEPLRAGWQAPARGEATPQGLWKDMGNVAQSPLIPLGPNGDQVGAIGHPFQGQGGQRLSGPKGHFSLPGLANSKASHMAFPFSLSLFHTSCVLGSISPVSQQAEISQQAKCPNTPLVLGEGVGITFSNNRRTENLWWLEASCFVGSLG